MELAFAFFVDCALGLEMWSGDDVWRERQSPSLECFSVGRELCCIGARLSCTH